MTNSDLSIIVCNYNLLHHLKIVVTEIKKLSPDSEIILADDHSSDGTQEWAKSCGFFDKIYVKPVREPYCLCTIRNEGIRLSTKSHILLLDSSCFPSRWFFASHIEVLNSGSKIVSQGIVNWMKDWSLPQQKETLFIKDKIVKTGWKYALGGNLAFPKDVWFFLNGFDENFNGSYGWEDNDFVLRAEKLGYSVYTHEMSIVYHLKHDPTCQKAINNKMKNFELMTKKHDLLKFLQTEIMQEVQKVQESGEKEFLLAFQKAQQIVLKKFSEERSFLNQ